MIITALRGWLPRQHRLAREAAWTAMAHPHRLHCGLDGGKVQVNGEPAKPHRAIREGDRLRIGRPFGRHQDIIVRIVLDQHVRKAEAKVLYDDVTPKPTPEEIEMRRIERVYRAATQAAGTPDRRRRREIRRSRGKT